VTGSGAGRSRRRHDPTGTASHSRWTLPLVIVLIIVVVAVVDHIGEKRFVAVDGLPQPQLVVASGGTVSVGLDAPWSGYNPNTPAGADSSAPALLAPVLPSTFEIGTDLQPTLDSALLAGVEVTNTTPFTVRYTINPQAVWSNGTPVTSADFVYAWVAQRGTSMEAGGTPFQAASTLGYRDIKSVTGSARGRVVTVVFEKPFTDWRMLFHDLVPASVAERVGWNTGFDTFNPQVDLSAGPLVLQSASASKGTAVLVPNPRWWGPKVAISSVVVRVRPGGPSTVDATTPGLRTAAQVATFNLATLDAVAATPDLKSSVAPSARQMELDFAVNAPVTSSLDMREAIAHAVDRTTLLDQEFGQIDPSLTVSEDHLAGPSEPAYAASPAALPYATTDLTTTDRLLRHLGYTVGPAGQFVNPAGQPLVLRMAVQEDDPWVASTAVALVSQLDAAGFTVVTVPMTSAGDLAATSSSYDLALVARTLSPYQTVTASWYSTAFSGTADGAAGAAGDADWSGYESAAVDALFRSARQQLNPVPGAAIYAQIDADLWNQMVALPLFEEPELFLTGVQLAGLSYNPAADGPLWDVQSATTLTPKVHGSAGPGSTVGRGG